MGDITKYELSKLSHKGFTLQTDYLEHILNVVSEYICTTCIEHEVCSSFNEMEDKEKVYELLGTPCGAEFVLEESE